MLVECGYCHEDHATNLHFDFLIEKCNQLMVKQETRINEQNQQIEKLKAELAARCSNTYCAYCGHTIAIDMDASLIADHISVCEKHPMQVIAKKLAEVEAKLREKVSSEDVLEYHPEFGSVWMQSENEKDKLREENTKLKNALTIIRDHKYQAVYNLGDDGIIVPPWTNEKDNANWYYGVAFGYCGAASIAKEALNEIYKS